MINSIKKITGNKTIIDYILEFVTNHSKKMRIQELRDLNCVQLAKELYLQFELVAYNSN